MRVHALATAHLTVVLVLAAPAAAAPPGPAALDGGPWPKTFQESGLQLSLYQPEPERWEGDQLSLRAAVAVKDHDATRYGILEIVARTEVDEKNQVVHLHDVEVTRSHFPNSGGEGRRYRATFETRIPERYDLPLQRVKDALAISEAQRAERKIPARNDPPEFAFRASPALLVSIDGAPVLRSVEGTALERVVNTRPLLVKDPATGRFYLHLLDGWMEAPALEGPYAVAKSPPASLAAARATAEKRGDVDLLEAKPGAPPAGAVQPAAAKPPPTLAAGAPEIVIATRPTELVVTEGAPRLEPIPGTQLLTWKNTTSDVFVDSAAGQTYVLAAGRWFRAAGTTGPFTWVDPKELPADFARIPPGHAREAVLASVPSTPQAKEALVANQIPQTAAVTRNDVRFEPTYDGPPQLQPIEGTPLHYVPNSKVPIIEVAPDRWYAVRDGVWFTAHSANGPWAVATWVPPVIYTIPPSSPLHYVTYVRIYDFTPDEVYVGYTPGYVGTYVSSGVVVYGTGWIYDPWIGTYWYGPPVTYGYGMRVYWSSWSGWGISASWGWRPWGYWWGFGIAPYWGPAVVYRPVYYPVPVPAYYGYRPAPAPARVATAGVYGQWSGSAVRPAPRPAPAPAALTAVRPAPSRLAPAAGSRFGPAPARPAPAPAATGRPTAAPAGAAAHGAPKRPAPPPRAAPGHRGGGHRGRAPHER